MYKESIYDIILNHLNRAISKEESSQAISLDMLPTLAQALEPVIYQYISQKESFPDPKTLQIIVNNFNQDAPRVRILLETRHSDEYSHWQRLREQLELNVRQRWSTINLIYQEEIVERTWLRIHRYLPRFLFMARFSTWVTRILLNEYLRLKPKIEKEKQKRSLDETDEEGRRFADALPVTGVTSQEKVESEQALEQLWLRIEQLGQTLDLKILRLHLAGYKLEEIKELLGGKPSVSTIWKRKKRLIERIEQDELIKEMAQEWGLLAEK